VPLLKHFGENTCWEINAESCKAYVERRGDGELGRPVKSGTARRELVTLSAALSFAHEQRKISQPVPVSLPRESEPRRRWFRRSEAAALVAGALGITATAYNIGSRRPIRRGRLFQPSYHVARLF
jgi:hypothetical protein